jgi:hypothetical protein
MPIKSWYPTYNIRIVRAASRPSGVDQAVREVVFYSIGKAFQNIVEWRWGNRGFLWGPLLTLLSRGLSHD